MRAITDIQNPAIRERYWIELMNKTKVRNCLYSLYFLSKEKIIGKNIQTHDEKLYSSLF